MAICPSPAPCQRPLNDAVVVGLRVKAVGELGGAAADVGRNPGGEHLLDDGLVVHIHVGDAGDTGGNHFRQAQGGGGPDGPVVPFGLGGEDILVQPGVQVAPAAVAPHQGHGHVGVGVDEAGHQHLASAVDDLVEGPGGPLRPHIGDLAPLHRHKGVGQHRPALVQEDGGDVLNENGHGVLLTTAFSGRPAPAVRTSPYRPRRRPAPPAR